MAAGNDGGQGSGAETDQAPTRSKAEAWIGSALALMALAALAGGVLGIPRHCTTSETTLETVGRGWTTTTSCEALALLPWIPLGLGVSAALILTWRELGEASIGPFSVKRLQSQIDDVKEQIVQLTQVHTDVRTAATVNLNMGRAAELASDLQAEFREAMDSHADPGELLKLVDNLEGQTSQYLVGAIGKALSQIQERVLQARGASGEDAPTPDTAQVQRWLRTSQPQIDYLVDAGQRVVRNLLGMDRRTMATILALAQLSLDSSEAGDDQGATERKLRPEPHAPSD